MLKVSVIVPVYNVENFIIRCVESIINQTYRNIELIIVDDASTDSSISKIKVLLDQTTDLSVKIINHDSNQGVSAARNTGLKVATGHAIQFVDSDDWCESQMIEQMIGLMMEQDVDIVVCNNFGVEAYSNLRTRGSLALMGKQDMQTALSELLNLKVGPNLWANLFKAHLFTGLTFPPGTVYEDKILFPYLWSRAKTLYFTDKPLYNYLLSRENSITTVSAFAKMFNKYEAIPYFLKKMRVDVQSEIESKSLKFELDLLRYDYSFIRNLGLKFSSQNSKYSKELNHIFILFNNHLEIAAILELLSVDKILSVQLILLKISPYLFWRRFR